MVTRGAAGWRLPVLVLVGGLLIGGLLIFHGGLRAQPASTARPAVATVVESAPCGSRDARDIVRVEVNGQSEQLHLDGCGNPVGTELAVELSGDGELMVTLAGTGQSEDGGLTGRLSVLLLVLAGLSGGLLTVILRARRVN